MLTTTKRWKINQIIDGTIEHRNINMDFIYLFFEWTMETFPQYWVFPLVPSKSGMHVVWKAIVNKHSEVQHGLPRSVKNIGHGLAY